MARQVWNDEWYQRQQGFLGDKSYSGMQPDAQRWGGTAGQVVNGWVQPGTSGADTEVARYQGMGDAAAQQTGPLIDQGRSDETRAMQMGSLASLQRVANGQDSQALALGRQQAYDAANGQHSMAASVRGGAMARAAANRAAMRGSARTSADIGTMARAGQAQEMQNARGMLAQGATGMRAQDLGFAGSQADLQARQRALGEQQQQAYERLGWDTRNADMNAGLESEIAQQQQNIADRQARRARRQQDYEETKWAASTTLGAMAGMSDVRSKTNIVPVGSLAKLMGK